MSAGEEFVKWLRPGGCALLIIIFVLVLIVCFSSGNDPLPGYESPHDTAYYAQNDASLTELGEELEENVFPQLEGEETWFIENGRVVVVFEDGQFAVSRAAILRYFDDGLFDFRKEGV